MVPSRPSCADLGAYLDYNARAPLRKDVQAAMVAALDCCGNPSSVHRHGRESRSLVEAARLQVAQLFAVRPSAVVFTSGATEANAMALHSTGSFGGLSIDRRLLVSAIEHDSVRASVSAETIPVLSDGRVDVDALGRLLASDPRPAIIAVMAVNNETGVIQPIADVSVVARRFGAILHCDATQAPGRLPVEDIAHHADMIALSAHKIGGPPGCGALLVLGDSPPAPLFVGGGQENRRRPGTENIIGIAGFGAACRAILDNPSESERVQRLRDGLETALRTSGLAARFYGTIAPRVGNTSSIGMPGVPAETQVMHFDLCKIAVSAGAACSSGKVQASSVLQSMGVDRRSAGEAIRVSLGWGSTQSDVDAFVKAWFALRHRTDDQAGAAMSADRGFTEGADSAISRIAARP